MDAEYARRGAANAAWLAEGFDLAKKNGNAAVFIAIQANPKFEPSFWRPSGKADGYAAFRQELLAHTLAFGKPVILIHGDTHRYRVDQPLVHTTPLGEGTGHSAFAARLRTHGEPAAVYPHD